MRKKIIFVSIITLLLAATGILPAAASTNGPHGSYAADTDACSACHETHQADFKNLSTIGEDPFETCIYCHSGNGSIYDVDHGIIYGDDNKVYRPNGGGYQQTLAPAAEGTTNATMRNLSSSMHNMDGALNTSAGPGGAGTAGLTEISSSFTCSSCHNPHGTASDRLLITSRQTVKEDGSPWTINVSQNFKINIVNPRTNETVTYLSGANDFCGLCHYDYNTASVNDPADNKNGKYTKSYRHVVGVKPDDLRGDGDATTDDKPPAYNPSHGLPLEQGKLTCLSCHNAHSTDASAAGTYSGGQSALLRMNERGVCWACHKW